MKISQGDTVVIIAGKDKGKKGTVLKTIPTENRVIVAGINMVTKHIKKTAQSEGRKMRLEHSIHISNVSAIDPKSGKPTRVGYSFDAKGHKVRIARKSGETLARVKISAEDAKKNQAAVASEPSSTKKKSPFWKKGGATAAQSEGGAKGSDSAPTQTTVTHTRSAGRGS